MAKRIRVCVSQVFCCLIINVCVMFEYDYFYMLYVCLDAFKPHACGLHFI